jgi:broad specificity phosphatase PhoE
VKALELRRHAPRDPAADRLSPEGQALAERVGRELPGGYGMVFTSPARRAAQTAAWFLRGLGQKLPTDHGVTEGLASPAEDRWRKAAKAAGSSAIDAIRAQDPALVEEEAARLAAAVRELLAEVREDARGLAIGHSPLIEAAVFGLTGTVIDPLAECEGVVVEEEGGEVRLGREYRLRDS